MKVKHLRLQETCYALKGENNFVANEHTKIELLGGGNFLIHHYGKIVFVHGSRAMFAECEPDQKK